MRYHLFQKSCGKMFQIKEMSFLSTRGAVCFALNCSLLFYHKASRTVIHSGRFPRSSTYPSPGVPDWGYQTGGTQTRNTQTGDIQTGGTQTGVTSFRAHGIELVFSLVSFKKCNVFAMMTLVHKISK